MKSMKQAIVALFLSGLISSHAYAVGSAGIGNEVNSARALGQGGVGVAGTTQDPAVVYMNPAGLTNLPGTRISLGGTWEDVNVSYEGSAANSDMRGIDAFVPNFALTQTFLDGNLGAGIGVFSPYGLETHWPGNGPLRYIATNSRLHILNVTPSMAYKITSKISVGVGLNYARVKKADLEKNVNMDNVNNLILDGLGLPPAFLGTPDAVSNLTGTGSNWGYHAGLTIEPTEKHAFGVVYHSRIKLNLNGSVSLTNISGAPAQAVFGGSRYSTSAFADIYLPQNLQFGYSFMPNNRWHFEVDAAWYDWTSNKDLNVRYPAATAAQVAILTNNGSGNPQPLNWRNTWNIETGVNFKATDILQLRTGFYYQPWVVPEHAFNPNLPDLTRYGLALGAGIVITPAFSVDLAYNAVFQHNRTINNSVGFNTTGDPSVTASGKYKTFTNLASLNFNYKFGNQ